MTLNDQFKAARRVSVPLVAIETADQAATIKQLMTSMKEGNQEVEVPVVRWDLIRGLVGLNQAGEKAVALVAPDADLRKATTANPAECLDLANKLPAKSVLFFLNAHRYLESEAVSQAIWNLRDTFKGNTRTLVLLGPIFRLPVELEKDVIMFEEPLPTDGQIGEIVTKVYAMGKLARPADEILSKAVRASKGLAAFPVEQVTAMSLTRDGVDLTEMWERKRKMIEQTKGLAVMRTGERFEDIGGIDNAKRFGKMIFGGAEPPSCVVFVDEIEKALQGAVGSGQDTTGISQDFLGVMLRAMEDNEWTGQICVGPPGCAKSMFAKSLGNTHEVPTITMDLGAAKGSLVGESEKAIREMVKVIQSVAGKGAYWVATCNRLDSLPPELRRRFRYGLWFFDLPSREERDKIWSLNLKRYGVKPKQQAEKPDDEGWTGADIRNCCEIAWRLQCSLLAASQFITPVHRSDPEGIQKLRKIADGRFLSASHAGMYRMTSPEAENGREVKL